MKVVSTLYLCFVDLLYEHIFVHEPEASSSPSLFPGNNDLAGQSRLRDTYLVFIQFT